MERWEGGLQFSNGNPTMWKCLLPASSVQHHTQKQMKLKTHHISYPYSYPSTVSDVWIVSKGRRKDVPKACRISDQGIYNPCYNFIIRSDGINTGCESDGQLAIDILQQKKGKKIITFKPSTNQNTNQSTHQLHMINRPIPNPTYHQTHTVSISTRSTSRRLKKADSPNGFRPLMPIQMTELFFREEFLAVDGIHDVERAV